MPVVTGDINQIAGAAVTSGEVRFTATTPVVQDPNARTTSLATSVAQHTAPLSGTGTITATLPATGDDWVYRVEISAYVGGNAVQGLPRLLLEVPASGADLSDAGIEGAPSGRVVVNRLVGNAELTAAVAPIQATADNTAARVDALEVLGGVEPGNVNDAEMALHAQQDGGLFNTALNAQTAAYVDPLVSGAVKSGTVTGIESPGAPGVVTFKVKPSRTFFDDFAGYTSGAFPAGWEQYGLSSARDWTARPSSAASDGNSLFTAGSGAGAISHPIFADMMVGEVDAEMVIKYRFEGGVSGGPSALMFGGGYPPNTANMFSEVLRAGYMSTTTAGFVETLAGVNAFYQVNPYPSAPVVDQWRVLLVRRVGEWSYLKDWPHGSPEPTEWLSTFGSSRLWSGWHGLYMSGGGIKRIDWIGFRAGPGAAPRGA